MFNEESAIEVIKSHTRYEYEKQKSQTLDDNNVPDAEELEVHEQSVDFMENEHFPYKLKSGHILRLRKKNKVIRYVRFNLKTNADNYFRENLLLFAPWNNEEELKEGYDSYEEAFKAKLPIINNNKAIFEPHSPDLEKAFEDYLHFQEINNLFEDVPSDHDDDNDQPRTSDD